MVLPNCAAHMITSPSSRRAWIEIMRSPARSGQPLVALLAEGVDRNFIGGGLVDGQAVALLAEGVDRNYR